MIWGEIDELANCLEAKSSSMEMGAIYRKERPRLDEYAANFATLPGQLGAVFLINGWAAGLEAFGKPETFAKLFKKIIESYAIEAIKTGEKYVPGGLTPHERAFYFTAGIMGCELESRPSVGLGVDVRLESIVTTGFALVHEEQILHLSAFNTWKF